MGFFRTLFLATRPNLNFPTAAPQDCFGNPQFQVLHVLTAENPSFDSETDNLENLSVSLQKKPMKAFPDPNSPPNASIDGHTVDVAEQTQFDQDTSCRIEITRASQEAPLV